MIHMVTFWAVLLGSCPEYWWFGTFPLSFLIIKQDHLHDHRVRGQLVSNDWVTSTTVYDYYHAGTSCCDGADHLNLPLQTAFRSLQCMILVKGIFFSCSIAYQITPFPSVVPFKQCFSWWDPLGAMVAQMVEGCWLEPRSTWPIEVS